MPLFVMRNLGIEDRRSYAKVCSVVGVAIVCMVGYLRHRKGQGHYGFHESGMHVNFETVSSGAFVTNFYAQRITAPAFLLGQIFLAAPLQLLKGIRYLKERVPREHGLEQKLEVLLTEVRAKAKWHGVKDYQDRMQEMLYLVRLDKVEFSPRQGRVRAAPH
jgi:hypothetical protein